MRNKLTKFLTSECPPKGMRQFAKTWKYAACMLLAFILGIGQMWGTATNFHDFVAAGDTIIDLEGSGSIPSAKFTAVNNTDWASVSTSAKNATVKRIDPSTGATATSTSNVYGTKLNSSNKTILKVQGVTGVSYYIGGGSSRKGYLNVEADGGDKWTQIESSALSTNCAVMTCTLDKDSSYTLTLSASGDIFCYAIKITVASKCTKPGTPTALAAGSVTHNSASLSWTAGANNNGHKIYIEKKSDKTKVLDWTDATSPYAASGLDPETTYTFKVKAKGATGYCDLGDEASADFATEVDPSATTYKVTLVPAGGTISDATGWTLNAGNYEKEVSDGTELTLPTFTKDNRTFKTWRNGAVDVTSPITVTADVTLTAVWAATVEQVIYSWESPDGTAVEVGGMAITKDQDGNTVEGNGNVNATLTNVTVAYKAIMLNGKISSNAWSGNYIQITTDEAVKAGDKVKVTACTTKGDTSKKGSAQMRAGASATSTAIFTDGNSYNDILADGTLIPNTKTFTVPDGVNTSTLTMTRSQSNTNCWVTKLQIIREVLVEEANIRTVTFNYNDGGATASTTVEVASGATVAAPADPTRAHYRFHEWQLGGVAYDFSTAVTSNITLTADWTQLYTVTYAKGEESATGDAPTQDELAAGEKFTVAANTFAYEGHDFSTWNDGSKDVAPASEYTMGSANVTLTAQWITATTKATVTYKDGTTTLGSEEVTISTGHPAEYATYQTKNLATFVAWYNNPDLAEEHKIADMSTETVSEATTYYAKWNYKYAVSTNIEQWVLTNGAGKTATTKTSALISQLGTNNFASNLAWENGNLELDSLDDAPGKTNRNYAYLGLKVKKGGKMLDFRLVAGKTVKVKFGNVGTTPNVAINGGEYETMTISEGVYSYTAVADAYISIKMADDKAVVFKQIMIGDAPEFETVVLPYRVTYDADGGTFAKDGKSDIYTGTALVIGDATPADDEHLFDGWYDGDTKINAASYVPTANVTLVAKYVLKPSPFSLTALTYTVGAGEAQNVGYVEGTYIYTVELPYAGSYENITVAATLKEAGSSIVDDATKVLTVTSLPGVATFTVSDGAEGTQLYTINFKKGAKDGVEIIGVVTTGGTNKTVSGLYKGDASVNLDADKKIGSNKYIYVTLAEGYTFEETDVLVVDVDQKSDLPNDPALEITTGVGNIDGSVWKSIANADYELNLVTIPLTGIAANQTSIGLKRSDHQNTWVNGLKVYRPMNPVLTAIQFNATDVEVTSTAVAATLPNGTNLSTMTVTPTIVWNGAGTAAPTAAWAWGANTYRVTDKDGDYTDYTITLTEAVPAVDPTLTYTEGAYMVGAAALDLSTLISASNSTGAITYSVKDAGTTGATITDGKFTATAAGTAIITASQAAVLGYNAKNVDFNVVVTVATEVDGIKLVEDGALTGNFVTARTLSNGENTVEGIAYTKYLTMSSTMTSFGNEVAPSATKGIYYYPSHKNIRFYFYVYNNQSSAKKIYIYTIDEDAESTSDATSANVSVDAGRHMVYVDVELTKHAAVVFGVENTGTQICQIVAVESGDALLQGGEAGYSIDYNKCYISPKAGTIAVYDGIEYKLYADAKLVSAGNVQLQTLGTHYIKFHLDNPMTVNVYSDNKKYYIGSECSTENAAKLYESTGDGEFSLAAGDWYINGSGAQVKINKLSFSLPKCAEPSFDALANSDICSGDSYVALDGTATITDAGTVTYKWYAEGADESNPAAVLGTDATYTPSADGKYYVIATNSLSGYSDNVKKSDLVSVTTFASAAITAAPENVRMDAGQNATLTVAASGKAPLSYQWYTCDDEAGTNPVLIDGADEATYEVSVTAGMSQYYKVVVGSGCGSAEAVALVEEWTELPQVSVSATTTWDWENAGVNIKLADGAGKNVEILMANIKVDGKQPTNDATFNSQALVFYGENVRAVESSRAYASIGHISFKVTVPGMVTVEFSDNGNNNRKLKINNAISESSASKTDVKTFSAIVPSGEVVLEGVNGDGTGNDRYIRISKIIFDANPDPAGADYTRHVTAGRFGTICLPNGGVMVGAELYEVAYKDPSLNKIFFDQIVNGEMIAGRPYIFLPKEGTSQLAVFYTDATDATAGNYHGLYGFIGATSTDEFTIPQNSGNYIIQNNQYREVQDGVAKIVSNRAYLKLNEIPGIVIAPLPGRKRMSIGAAAPQVVTGIDELNASEAPRKVLINGELFILRGEKMYDAKGQLVK